MIRTTKMVFTLVAVLTGSPASAQVVNPSFESPAAPSGSFTNYPGGSTTITGWTVVGTEVSIVNETFSTGGITFQAQSGAQWVDLTGFSSNANTNGLRQFIPTIPGQVYLLEFYVGSANNGGNFLPASVDLSIDGGARSSYINPTGPSTMLDWQLFGVQFTATSTTTNVTFFNGSAGNNFCTGLDNVSMTAVPEPTSLALSMIAALAGFLVRTRRIRFALRSAE